MFPLPSLVISIRVNCSIQMPFLLVEVEQSNVVSEGWWDTASQHKLISLVR
jgi:hypothetical protein